MHLIHRHRLWIDNAGVRIALTRWGDVDPGKPVALLLHGTGFVGEIWDEIANGLAARYTVYALDRRGHGASDKPGRYHFADFASDLAAAIETLGLSGIYGIGHSAGATDLLLAAKLLPDRFARLFVMEPTVMDPSVVPGRDARLSDQGEAAVSGARRRQAEFASAAAAFERYRSAPAFAPWSEYALRAYITHGFAHLPDGRVRLLCSPDVETEILRPIFEAMEQVYRGDERGNPFDWMRELGCPVRIATAELSWPIYKEMATRASALIPGASRIAFDGVGHCVAQETPARLLTALEDFAAA
ncbi:alpha/beta hydrolase fold [Rhodopseudomonas palustris TIE-1]|uniref:alpha/beta fold hydrolase n=1 Tax=Rhodopseudomonas palustris TaxID=1076 RepID=UPI000164B391|nr:alpha/beta hydrolase [Rhodopseudomonas palustris]ACF02748.1 alpha/beta hydrolase fold [Rhodopseudomonas palustris TIE-1]